MELRLHHSSEEKSDFANWVRDVIGDGELAGDLSRCNNATQAARSVRERIAWLKDKEVQLQAYYVKCRKKVDIKNPKAITMKNGHPATQGVCPACGTKVFRIGKS